MPKKHERLPNAKTIRTLERAALKRLKRLAKIHDIGPISLERGSMRIQTKADVAELLAHYMEDKHIATVEELADVLYIGFDFIDALHWLRFPSALHMGERSSKSHDAFLLALCEKDD